MTKKHYIELAKGLRYHSTPLFTGRYKKMQLKAYDAGFRAAIGEMIYAMQCDNPNFDRQRFEDAVYNG